MAEPKTKTSPGIFAVVAWMAVNVIFFGLEVTVLNDAADLNNSILLVLMLASIGSLFIVRKYGVAITAFVLTYAFSFNAFNLIYFDFSVLNTVSALLNIASVAFLFSLMLKKQ